MKLGFHIVDIGWPGDPAAIGATLAAIAPAVEAAGFDRLAVADHVWQNPYLGGPERAMLEAYTTLAFLAAHTRRVRLLTLATAVSYRAPGLLAKMITTLDVLSGGRAGLGIGAGYDAGEARGLGLSLPPAAERFELLEETIQVCLRMWSGEHGDDQPFHGKHVSLERALNLPQALTKPHPPLLIAGEGERKTLRLVARYADASGFYPTPAIPHKLEMLQRHCAAEGTDYDRIEKTSIAVWNIDPDRGDGARSEDLLGQLRWLAEMGIETAFVQIRPAVDLVPHIATIGRDVIPVVAAW